MRTTVRLIADEPNMSCRAGQAALVTAFQLIARMGIGIELLAPEVEVVADAPGLRRRMLRAALLDLASDLIPNTSVRCQEFRTELTFVFGDTPCSAPGALCVTVSEFAVQITAPKHERSRIECEQPLGALAAGPAAAAIALDCAMPNIERTTGIARTRRPLPQPGPPVSIDLTQLFPSLRTEPADLGRVDVISAGAVTNALINTLLWLPGISAQTTILDDDSVDWHNLNRCPQFRASDVGNAKVDALATAETRAFRIQGVKGRFERRCGTAMPPLAPRWRSASTGSKPDGGFSRPARAPVRRSDIPL